MVRYLGGLLTESFLVLQVLCCAFTGGNVSRPMFAAFVSLSFAFLHIRVWPYRRQETNFHKAVSDFTICFVSPHTQFTLVRQGVSDSNALW